PPGRPRVIDPGAPGPGEAVFLFAARRLLLVLHAAGSIVLTGAATHHALQMRHYLRGRFAREKLEKTWAKVVAVAYAVTFAIGAQIGRASWRQRAQTALPGGAPAAVASEPVAP